MREMKIFIDMDNTIVNLDETVMDIMNHELSMNYNYKDNTSWWWLDTGLPRSYFQNMLLRNNLFWSCNPIEDSIKYVNDLYESGYEVIFITSPQWESNNCMTEKVLWLQLHFNKWFDPDKHLVFTTRKELLCAKGENNILIDDATSNLDKWGGIKICKATSCNKDYVGFRCEKWCEIYELIKLIEKGEK